MLTSLEIIDYALIQNIKVEFDSGLNIITGETGAGKSILIGALGLLLGERASTESVRKGAKKSFVEGIFDIGKNPKVKKFLFENEFDDCEELIVRREISVKGSNRCFINDTPVQLASIKKVGDLLIDLHGQHDHQSLLKVETHIDFLDEFCNIEKELKNYTRARNNFISTVKKIIELKKNEKSLKEKLELNSFQLKEINSVAPENDEDIKIEKELNILENSEKLFDASSNIYNLIYDSDTCVYDQMVTVKNNIDLLTKIDDSVKEKKEELDSAIELIRDVGDFVRDYRDKIEIDPEAIEDFRERSGAIHLLKKKYGGSLNSVLAFRDKIEEELSYAENFSENIEQLEKEAELQRKEIENTGLALSSKRKKEAAKIEKLIEKSLEYLGISNSKFKINFSHEFNENSEYYCVIDSRQIQMFNNGIDVVEFFIAANKGEDLKPLAKTASGGEISRIMLAIKSVMAKTEKLPLLVFDEIDTGISGRIAQKVGEVLKGLAHSHQIISITHLPQIAAIADHHYSVQKETNSNRVVTLIKKLDQHERVNEVAKLISGETISTSNLNTAKELIETLSK